MPSEAPGDSLGEQIQRAFPQVRVVKALNTVTAAVTVDPRRVADGDHHIFVSGNAAAAEARVTAMLTDWFGWFGWREVIDLGDISPRRGHRNVPATLAAADGRARYALVQPQDRALSGPPPPRSVLGLPLVTQGQTLGPSRPSV